MWNLESMGFSAEIQRAYDAALHTYAHRADVTAVDIGYRMREGATLWETELVVRIHVRRKRAPEHLRPGDSIPTKLLGVSTDVIEATYAAHETTPSGINADARRKSRQAPLCPGISIGHHECTAGTIGMFGSDEQGNVYILSSDHVLVPDFKPKAGAPVLQPGPEDGGLVSRDTVARLSKWDRLTGAAIAICDPRVPLENKQFESDVLVSGTEPPAPGIVLEKSGRTTGVTRARVSGMGGGYEAGLGYAFTLVPEISAPGKLISHDGDSGAVWYNPQTCKAVGLHCRGNPSPTLTKQYAVATSLSDIERFLKIAL